jgi:hypothetical protein
MDIGEAILFGGGSNAGRHTDKAILPVSSIAFSRWMKARQQGMF